MTIMLRHLKYMLSLQRCVNIRNVLNFTVPCGNSSYLSRTNHIKILLCGRTFLLNHNSYFSTRVSKVDVSTILQSKDKEKYSDSDSDSERESNDNIERAHHSVEREDILEAAIAKGKPLSSSEWETLKDQCITSSRSMTADKIDAITIARCVQLRAMDVALSYIDHLKLCEKKLNIATIAHFLRLCYVCKSMGVNKQLVLSMYDELRSRCSVFDAYTAECVILALCLTDQWKESLELLDMIKLSCIPGGFEYNAIVATAFENNDAALGMNLIEEMVAQGRKIRPVVYHAWLDYYDRISNGDKLLRWNMVQELLMYFVENDVKPSLDVVEKIRDFYLKTGGSRLQPHAEYTGVTARGICKSCRKPLNSVVIKDDEFKVLRSAFVNEVLIGKDIFLNTTPEEVKEFQNFVRMTAPYDVVLDGLNIALAIPHNKSPKSFARLLFHVVKHFVAKSQKVLVLGRKHMQQWPKEEMAYIFKNAHVFLAQNISQDDPFLLYATLYSGMGTQFVSKDLMRSHAYVLKKKELRSTFRRWQLQHQILLRYVTEAGKVHLKLPLAFNPMAQTNSDGSWHIPYVTKFVVSPAQSFEAPSSWLCLRSEEISLRFKPKEKRSNVMA